MLIFYYTTYVCVCVCVLIYLSFAEEKREYPIFVIAIELNTRRENEFVSPFTFWKRGK